MLSWVSPVLGWALKCLAQGHSHEKTQRIQCGSNPGLLDCESNTLPLSHAGPWERVKNDWWRQTPTCNCRSLLTLLQLKLANASCHGTIKRLCQCFYYLDVVVAGKPMIFLIDDVTSVLIMSLNHYGFKYLTKASHALSKTSQDLNYSTNN